MYHSPTLGSGGGVVAQATITSTVVTPTNATLCWYGMQGFYSIEMSTNLTTWSTVGSVVASEHDWCATVTNSAYPIATFRLNQANGFVGSGACAGCHGENYAEYLTTKHSGAYDSATNFALIARAVGLGQPTGFIDATSTPHLKNVGCESCHGPAAWHKFSDHSLVRPAVSIDPKICGSCHQGPQHPTYEEYHGSLHAEVNGDLKYGTATPGAYFSEIINVMGTNWYGYFVTTNGDGSLKTNRSTGILNSNNGPIPGVNYLYDPGQDRAAQCGVCHSAATRMAMLKDYEARLDGRTNALAMADPHAASEWSATCATCHDPHAAGNPMQLRHPMRSTNYYTMPTTTDKRTVVSTNFQGGKTTNVVFMGTTFASLYDPNVQVCGQCHNTRGARWDGRSFGLVTNSGVISVALSTNTAVNGSGLGRPPHYSAQYNVLIGIVQPDYLNTNALGVATNFTATHSGLAPRTIFNTNQCATCHMPAYLDPTSGGKVTGHSYALNAKGCSLGGCHTAGVPDVEGYQINTTNNLRRLVDLLSQWATNKGPALLGATDYNKHKANTWEYTIIGSLAGSTNAGPAATNQVKLPKDILQARFNAYMVKQDGSMGVHNPRYSTFMLRDAEAKVLRQFSVARFTANPVNPVTNVLVTFTNLSVGMASCTWDFGDGGTSTSTAATVQRAYAAAGPYTVKLTVTDTNGVTETMVRNSYILAYERPVPSFTATPVSGTAPLTVSFVNNSSSAMYYRWTFMNGVTGSPYSNEQNPPSFTYTNAGTYQVRLTAYNEATSVAITNIITVTP